MTEIKSVEMRLNWERDVHVNIYGDIVGAVDKSVEAELRVTLAGSEGHQISMKMNAFDVRHLPGDNYLSPARTDATVVLNQVETEILFAVVRALLSDRMNGRVDGRIGL